MLFRSRIFKKKSGRSAAISAQPGFGPNPGKRGPISATSGPSRPETHFGPQNRGASKANGAKNGRRGRRADSSGFFKKSGFPGIRILKKKSGRSAAISAQPGFGPNPRTRGPISATSGPSRPATHFGPQNRGTSKANGAKNWRRGRRADLSGFF